MEKILISRPRALRVSSAILCILCRRWSTEQLDFPPHCATAIFLRVSNEASIIADPALYRAKNFAQSICVELVAVIALVEGTEGFLELIPLVGRLGPVMRIFDPTRGPRVDILHDAGEGAWREGTVKLAGLGAIAPLPGGQQDVVFFIQRITGGFDIDPGLARVRQACPDDGLTNHARPHFKPTVCSFFSGFRKFQWVEF
jgi:hypothetical protein